MSTGADEEARLLDKKIAEIRRKNEAILKRRKEIEEDKKFAEEQNAVVKLRPSIEDWPRERTPAMKPSRREMAVGDPTGNPPQNYPTPRSSGRRERPGTSSRGSDLMEKGAGPPPDPRSFLFDPDRDVADVSREKPERSRAEFGQEFRGSPRERGDFPGENQLGRRGRGGLRRGRGEERRGRGDEAWRVERNKIDEARIERQRDSDGRWRREWDNEKLNFEVEGDDNKHPAFTPPKSMNSRLNQWKQSTNRDNEFSSDPMKTHGSDSIRTPGRDPKQFQGSTFSRGFDPKISPDRASNAAPGRGNATRSPKHSSKPSSMISCERTVLTESENVKIVIRNKEPGTKEANSCNVAQGKKVDRRPKKRSGSGILRTSQSSVSEDDDGSSASSPSKFTQYENMTFTIKNEPIHMKRSDLEKMTNEDFIKLSKVAKPPLPPFRASTLKVTEPANQDIDKAKSADEGDDSWEDVTTSGTESVCGESGPESLVGTPVKVVKNTKLVQNEGIAFTPDDFICLVQPGAPSNLADNTILTNHIVEQIQCDNNIASHSYQNVEHLLPVHAISLEPSNTNTTLTSNYTNNQTVSDPNIHYSLPAPNPVNIDIDNYIVLVQPDTSFEELVQQENENAQNVANIDTAKENIDGSTVTVLPQERPDIVEALVSNSNTKDI